MLSHINDAAIDGIKNQDTYIAVKISGEPDSRMSTKTDFHNDLISIVKNLPKLDWIKLLWIVVLFLLPLDREVERENRCVRRCRG